MLLDEPCEGSHPSIVDDIWDVIHSIKFDGRTAILLVEQNKNFVKSAGNYFYVLEKGAIIWEGGLEALDNEVVRKCLTV